MATDPICGMQVDDSTPLKVERAGTTFYFCSEHCRRTFVAQLPGGPGEAPATTDRATEPAGPREPSLPRRRIYNSPPRCAVKGKP